MKKIFLLLAVALSFAIQVNAQIAITSTEMPHAGDTARLTKAVNNPFLNYSATGASHNWNFTNLKADVQELREFQSVSSTGLLYAITFADIFFNANRANVATTGTFSLPANGFLTIDNPYNFYYRNASQYRQVGIGSDITAFGIGLGGIPTVYDQFDVIYNLPLNYGDQDTSNSAFSITIPLVPISYAFRQTRINNVDGWGTLQTPHGIYDVIRVKTTLMGHDSLGFDTLGIPVIEIDRPVVNEYKWLALNEIVPIMQVNTQIIFGLEVITDIFFRDDFLNVYPGTLNSSYCAGSPITIPYTAEGTFNTGGILIPANQFRAQLSDATGSFASPVQIGQVTSNVSGTINATIPANTPEGSGYRIRIVSTSPAMEGPDNGTDIYIATQPVSAIVSNGGSTICDSTSVSLSATAGNGYTYQWQLNGVDIAGETLIGYTASQTGDYTVVTTNMCGTATSNIIHVDAATSPVAQINTTANIFCAGDSLLIATNYENGLTYQWLLDGNIVSGASDTIMYALQSGNYSLLVSNGGCSDTSAALAVTMQNLATANISSSGNNSICDGDTVVLSETSATGVTYQWQFNGVDIAGETSASLNAFQTGDYNIVTTNLCGSATSNIIHLDVLAPPSSAISSASNTFCAGDSLLLSIVYENGVSYQWLLDGNIITGATDTLMYASLAGNYSVVASNGICADVTSIAVAVTITNPPTAAITTTGNTSICLGDSVLLSETSATGVTYQWQLDSVDIVGETNSALTAFQTGDYTVIATNLCGTATSNSIHIDVTIPAIASISSGSTSFCAGDSLLLNAVYETGNTYQWVLDGNAISGAIDTMLYATQAGTYTVIVTGNGICPAVTSNGISVSILSAPVSLIAASGNTTLCAGDSIVLNETSASGSTYQWQMDSVDINGATLSSYTVTQSGNYNVVVGNSCGNSISNIINVIVNPLPTAPVITQQLDSLVSTSANTYQWYFNGVLITGANSQYYIPTQNGDYTVVITDANGCTNMSAIFTFNSVGIHENSATYLVTVTPNPVSDILNIDFNVGKGLTVSVSLISCTGAEAILLNAQRTNAGFNHFKFDLKQMSLAAGIYFVKVQSDSNVVYAKVVKQ